MKTVLVFLLFGAALAAQSANKPPVIPAELQTEIAFLQMDALRAQIAADRAGAASNAAMQKAQTACGADFSVERVGNLIVCAPKPKAPIEGAGK